MFYFYVFEQQSKYKDWDFYDCNYCFIEGIGYEDNCTVCEGGVYCSSQGLTAPTANCSANYYCIAGATQSSPTDGVTGNVCPKGHYCPAATGPSPIPCTEGMFQSVEAQSSCSQCVQGYYCVDGINQEPCPQGFYCPTGTGSGWLSCPAGTYGNSEKLYLLSECMTCDGGQYCDVTNLTAPAGPCDPGYYCRSGSDTNQPTGFSGGDAGPCPVGHYCESGTQEPTPCPLGTFSNQTMLTAASECTPCSPGYYCDATGLTEPVGLCLAGFYCTGGSNSSSPPVNDATGGPCPVGQYCTNGTSVPVDCPAGTFQTSEQQSSCDQCPKGYYCESGAFTNSPCPAGKFQSSVWNNIHVHSKLGL